MNEVESKRKDIIESITHAKPETVKTIWNIMLYARVLWRPPLPESEWYAGGENDA